MSWVMGGAYPVREGRVFPCVGDTEYQCSCNLAYDGSTIRTTSLQTTDLLTYSSLRSFLLPGDSDNCFDCFLQQECAENPLGGDPLCLPCGWCATSKLSLHAQSARVGWCCGAVKYQTDSHKCTHDALSISWAHGNSARARCFRFGPVFSMVKSWF